MTAHDRAVIQRARDRQTRERTRGTLGPDHDRKLNQAGALPAMHNAKPGIFLAEYEYAGCVS